jgi:hypothetical protein
LDEDILVLAKTGTSVRSAPSKLLMPVVISERQFLLGVPDGLEQGYRIERGELIAQLRLDSLLDQRRVIASAHQRDFALLAGQFAVTLTARLGACAAGSSWC